MRDPEKEVNHSHLRQPKTNELFVHSILATRDPRKITKLIGESGYLQSGKVQVESSADEKARQVLDYQVQCSHITPTSTTIFDINQFAFLFTPEALERSGALIFDERRGDYPGIVTIFDVNTGKIGGARIPIQDTILLVDPNVFPTELSDILENLKLKDPGWLLSHVFLWQTRDTLVSALQEIAGDRNKLESIIHQQWHNWIFTSLGIFEVDKLTKNKVQEKIKIPSKLAIEIQRERIDFGRKMGLITEEQAEEIVKKLDLAIVIRNNLDE